MTKQYQIMGYDRLMGEIYKGQIYSNEDLARAHLRSCEWVEIYDTPNE